MGCWQIYEGREEEKRWRSGWSSCSLRQQFWNFFWAAELGIILSASILIFFYYRHMAVKEFGWGHGGSGGFFLQICELGIPPCSCDREGGDRMKLFMIRHGAAAGNLEKRYAKAEPMRD